MSYKDKTLMTLFTLTVFFGWLYAQNYRIQNPNDVFKYSTEVGPNSYPDAIVLLEYTNKEKEQLCRKNRECEKLSETLVFEARSEPLQGAYAVASVVLNRVDDRRWPNSIIGVIEQPYQFSYLMDKDIQRKPDKADWERARVVAYNTIYNEIQRVTIATHYHEKSISPFWSKKLDRLELIGQHVFYKGY